MDLTLRIITLAALIAVAYSGKCEVCEKFLNENFAASSAATKGSEAEIQETVRSVCKKFPDESQFRKLCYDIGGLEISAATQMKDLSKYIKLGFPNERICSKLSVNNAEVCAKLQKAIDLKNIDLKKTRVKELKKIITSWQTVCDDCLEKSDYIRFIEENKSKYVPKEEL